MYRRSALSPHVALKWTHKVALSSLTAPQPPANAEILLFSHKICPYCCKTVALLRHLGIPFAEQEVSPLTKSQIKWSTEYKKVPIAVFSDGKVFNDSALISEELLKRFPPSKKGEDSLEFVSESALEWVKWSTDTLAVMMYPNITRTFAECCQALAYFGGPFSSTGATPPPGIAAWDAALTQTIGAFGMSMAHGKVKNKYGITNERESLLNALSQWEAELAGGSESSDRRAGGRGPFRRGAHAPDLADVSVYGVLCAAQGVPLFDEMLTMTSSDADEEASLPHFKAWLLAMESEIPPPNRISMSSSTEQASTAKPEPKSMLSQNTAAVESVERWEKRHQELREKLALGPKK